MSARGRIKLNRGAAVQLRGDFKESGIFFESCDFKNGSLMAILKCEVVTKNSSAEFEVKKEQRLRIAGKRVVDFVAFNLNDLTERFDQAAARGLDGAKRIASIACSRVGQKENPIQTWRSKLGVLCGIGKTSAGNPCAAKPSLEKNFAAGKQAFR
jgi:uncharacterized protein YcgI (DUF1989 family)